MRKNIFIYSVFAFLAFASVSCVKESSAVEGTSATGSVAFRICGNDEAVTKGWTGDPGEDSVGLLEEDIDNYVTTLDIYAFNASTGALVWRSEHYVSDYACPLDISNPFTGWNNAESNRSGQKAKCFRWRCPAGTLPLPAHRSGRSMFLSADAGG